MPIVYIHNQATNRIESYSLPLSASMPYVTGGTLTVREFKAASCSQTLWTDKSVMEAWNNLRGTYGRPIPVGFAFRRIWEGGHGGQSQHYAGVAFDLGQGLSDAERAEIHGIAQRSGVWTYVEPLSMTPRWVHVDRRYGTPACAAGGYPMLREGSRGVYVFTLQDALAAAGFPTGGLDGIFGPNQRRAVMNYQKSRGLTEDGVVGCNTWKMLTGETVGIGQTPSVLAKC